MTKHPFQQLTDEELIAHLAAAAGVEREATTNLIALLAEMDARRLYLAQGYSSLFVYCTRSLHLSEHAAYGRIEAARAARKFPLVLDLLADGSITLTTICLTASHLTPDNHRALLESTCHKSKREVEQLIAAVRPLPPVPSAIRKLPERKEIGSQVEPVGADENSAPSPARTGDVLGECGPPPKPSPSVIRPLAPERYKVQVTIDRATHDKLRRAQDLCATSSPTVIRQSSSTAL